MTREEIIELLQKIKCDEKGHSTNLEYYSTTYNEWNPVAEDLAGTLLDISDGVEYRIKPEPKYVPFAFEDAELFWLKRIKRKNNKSFVTTILAYDDRNVYFDDDSVTYEQLLSDYEFNDGTPAGRLV